MNKRTAAVVQAEWSKVGDAIVELDLALGNRPWDVSIADPAWRNPHAEGSAQHAALAEVHAEAVRLDGRRTRLRAELDRLHETELATNVRRSAT